MMSLLLTRYAGHDSGSSVWCSKLYLLCMEGGTCVYMQETHVHAGTEEGAVSLGPGPMGTLLDGME